MSSSFFPPMPNAAGYSEQIRRDVAAIRRMGLAAAMFLTEAFPHVNPVLIRELQEAWVDWYTWDAEGHIAQHEAQLAAAPSMNDQYLVNLCAQRDRMAEQIEKAEQAANELPVEGIGKIVRATMIEPLRSALEQVEIQISTLQRAMEHGADAAGQ